MRGGVITLKLMEKNRKIVYGFLDKIGIKYIKRFGEWDYLWSDQSLMSGKRIVDNICQN